MPILHLSVRGAKLVLAPARPTASPSEREAWHALMSLAVGLAFVDRPALVVTLSPQTWSFGHLIPGSRAVATGGKPYLLGAVERCTPEFLLELCGSEDFLRGLLWLTTGAEEEVLPALRFDPLAAEVTSTGEVLICTDDGLRLTWLNAGRPLAPVRDELAGAAPALHWSVEPAP
jgi:hypothetical protein